MLIPYYLRIMISIASLASGQLSRITYIQPGCIAVSVAARQRNAFTLREDHSPLKYRESGETLARETEGGQSGGRESGSFGTGPLVLEAWGENAVCLPDRDAGGAERLRQLSRCFFHLLSERAAPRDVSEPVRVLRRGATGMR